MTDLSGLNGRFGLSDQLFFRETPDGLVVMEVTNAHGVATIALQGGHVMTWRPKPQVEPVIWLSPAAKFLPGKSIRGGVPVCWPWFGPAADPALPAHGFARTVPWEVTATGKRADGATEIALKLLATEQTRALWPHSASLSMAITVGPRLKIALSTDNFGKNDLVIGDALHTYFNISDIAAIRINGLERCEYLDKAGGGNARCRQEGPIVFSGETDRVYLNTEAECVIEDPGFKRRLHVAKSGSRSTVVWNPWSAKAAKMGDFGMDGWRRMVCVESANATDNVVTVKTGGHHVLAVEYWAEDLNE